MAQIITLANKRWLTGMAWRSYDDIPDKQDLLDDAKLLNASWSALRIENAVIQAGFCEPIDGIKTPGKLFSLAATLAASRAQPWSGTFKIREGLWWYIAARDGHALLPDGDLIGGKEEIEAIRAKHATYGDWDHLEGDIDLLTDLIKFATHQTVCVKSLSGQGLQIVPIAIAILLIGGVGGGYFYWQEKEKKIQIARARAQVLAQIQAQPNNVVPANTHLVSKPSPNHWLSACQQATAALPLSLNGWAIDQVECDLHHATIKWGRKWGATVAKRPEGNVSENGDVVHQTIPLQISTTSKDDAIGMQEAMLAMQSWTQAIAVPFKMDAVQRSQDIQRPMLVEAQVAMELPISPFKLNLDEIPGLRLTHIASTATGWMLKGSLYGR